MYAPGWYHAQGDAVGTVRYWDGQSWQGEATSLGSSTPTAPATGGGIVYYDAGSTKVDLGDVATQKTFAEQAGDGRTERSYALSPYSVTKSSATVTVRRPRSSAFNLATLTLLSVIGPALLFFLGVRGPLLWAVIGLLGLGMTLGRAKTMTSIWSGMRTTR